MLVSGSAGRTAVAPRPPRSVPPSGASSISSTSARTAAVRTSSNSSAALGRSRCPPPRPLSHSSPSFSSAPPCRPRWQRLVTRLKRTPQARRGSFARRQLRHGPAESGQPKRPHRLVHRRPRALGAQPLDLGRPLACLGLAPFLASLRFRISKPQGRRRLLLDRPPKTGGAESSLSACTHASGKSILSSMLAKHTRAPRGPRGGRTTITKGGLFKKTVYFNPEEWQTLRARSFEEARSIAEIIRELVRHGLGLQD